MAKTGKILQSLQGLGQGPNKAATAPAIANSKSTGKTDATKAAIEGHNEVVVGKKSKSEQQNPTQAKTVKKLQNKSASERAVEAAWKGKYFDAVGTDGSRAEQALKDPNLVNVMNNSTNSGNLIGGHRAPDSFATLGLNQGQRAESNNFNNGQQLGTGKFNQGSGNQVVNINHGQQSTPPVQACGCNDQAEASQNETPTLQVSHETSESDGPGELEPVEPEIAEDPNTVNDDIPDTSTVA